MAYWLSRVKIKPVYKASVLTVLVVVAFFDQFPDVQKDSWLGGEQNGQEKQAFYMEIEESLEDGAMVYQLPFSEFPEAEPVEQMDAYTPLAAYVFTDTIRWSGGGIKGRNEMARSLYVSDGVGEDFLSGIKEAGFQGVCINITGYSEERGAEVLDFYSGQLGLTPIVSEDGTLYFYKF